MATFEPLWQFREVYVWPERPTCEVWSSFLPELSVAIEDAFLAGRLFYWTNPLDGTQYEIDPRGRVEKNLNTGECHRMRRLELGEV